MPDLSDAAWERLHQLRLRGTLSGSQDPATVELVDIGYALRKGDAVVISPAGREANAAWARLPEGSDAEAMARRSYEQFLVLDRVVKRVTAEWQTAAVNARPDGFTPDDWKIIDRLVGVHEKAGGFLRRLGETAPRFDRYWPKLCHAIEQLEEGQRPWFSGLKIDSYHTVWWQLHEDLLAALGIARSDDPNQ